MGCLGAGNGVLWKWYSGGLMGSHWEIAPDHVGRNASERSLDKGGDTEGCGGYAMPSTFTLMALHSLTATG